MKLSHYIWGYVVLCAIWIYNDSKNHDISSRWALASLLFHPIVFPWYLIKTRAKGAWKPIGLWIFGFLIVSSIYGIYSGFVTPYDESQQATAVEKELIEMFDTSKKTHDAFEQALADLNNIQDPETIPEINEAIKVVDRTERLLYEVNKDMNQIEAYIKVNEAELEKTQLADVVIIKELYGSSAHKAYRKALKNYLDAYKVMVIFIRDNHDKIIGEDRLKLAELEDLSTKYVTALEAQNKAYIEFLQFVKTFREQNPKAAEYLEE